MGMKSHLFHNIKCTQSICTPVITQYKYTLSIAFWVKYARPCNKRGSVRLCKARKRCEVIHCPPFSAVVPRSRSLSLWPCVPQGHVYHEAMHHEAMHHEAMHRKAMHHEATHRTHTTHHEATHHATPFTYPQYILCDTPLWPCTTRTCTAYPRAHAHE